MHLSTGSPIGFAQTWLLSHFPSRTKHDGSQNLIIFQDAVTLSSFNKQTASPFSFIIGE